MRRAWMVAIAVAVLSSMTMDAHAFIFGKKKAEQTATGDAAPAAVQPAGKAGKQAAEKVAAPKVDKALQQALELKRRAVEQKRVLLNRTEWKIDMLPLSGTDKKESDILTFKDNQVSAASFGKRGFPASNFTLTVQDDGGLIWETMQTSETSGIVFWRGEIDPEIKQMRGILSHKADEKTSNDYSFSSTGKRDLPASEASQAAAAAGESASGAEKAK